MISIGWGRADPAIPGRAYRRKGALVGVHRVLPIQCQLIALRELALHQPASRRSLPLRLGGQLQAGLAAIGQGIVPGDMHDRMVFTARDA